MCCLETNQYMNVVRNAADCFRNDLQCFGRSTKVGVKARTPGIFNKWSHVFGTENNVYVQAEMR